MKVKNFWSYHIKLFCCHLFPYHLGTSHELFCVLSFYHLLAPAWSGFWYSLEVYHFPILWIAFVISRHLHGSWAFPHYLYLRYDSLLLAVTFMKCIILLIEPFHGSNFLLPFVASINVFVLFEHPLFWSRLILACWWFHFFHNLFCNLCHLWIVHLITCLFRNSHIHLLLFWGEPNILQHFLLFPY